jgi:hypothetical protein
MLCAQTPESLVHLPRSLELEDGELPSEVRTGVKAPLGFLALREAEPQGLSRPHAFAELRAKIEF